MQGMKDIKKYWGEIKGIKEIIKDGKWSEGLTVIKNHEPAALH